MSELEKLKKYLDEHGYESYWRKVISEKDQIVVFKDDNFLFDVICHEWSYGGNQGLLEIMGSIVQSDDDVMG